MARTRLHFPVPNRDELLYSLIARFRRHLGLASAKHVLELVFDSRTVIATADLQGRLGRLEWVLERWGSSPEIAAWDYTVLPYYASSLRGGRRLAALRSLIDDRPSGLHTRLGICASRVRTPETLRLCPQCSANDHHELGDTYWRRVHQLPGVLVCPEHGAPLVDTPVPLRGHGRHEFWPALEEHLAGSAAAEDLTRKERDLALAIARRSRDLLSTPFTETSPDPMEGLRHALSRLGYYGCRGGPARLEKEFRSHFGVAFLQRLESGVSATGGLSWLHGLRRNPPRRLHPLNQILLELFIEVCEGTEAPIPFGPGPWPCRNPLASHRGKPVIQTVERFTSRRGGGAPRGRFRCSCGYVYTQGAIAGSEPEVQVVELGPLYVQAAKDMQTAGYRIRRIAWALDVDSKTVKRLLADQPAESALSVADVSVDPAGADKREWKQLIRDKPGAGVKALRKQAPALYARLYRRCHSWLRQHSPKVERANPRQARVDWVARDAHLAVQAGAEARRIQREEPKTRITANRLAARLGCRALFQKKLDLLPQVRAMLEQVCESPEAFRIRRLRHAISQAPAAQPWRWLRNAGIREAYVTDAILDVIREAERYTGDKAKVGPSTEP